MKEHLKTVAERIEKSLESYLDFLEDIPAYKKEDVKPLIENFLAQIKKGDNFLALKDRNDYKAILGAIHSVILTEIPESMIPEAYKEVHHHYGRTLSLNASFATKELTVLLETLLNKKPLINAPVDKSVIFKGNDFEPKPMAEQSLEFLSYTESDFEEEMKDLYRENLEKIFLTYKKELEKAKTNEELEEVIDEIKELPAELDSITGNYINKLANMMEVNYDEELPLEENKISLVNVFSQFEGVDNFISFVDSEFPDLYAERRASFREDELDYLEELLSEWEEKNLLFCLNGSVFVDEDTTFFEYSLPDYVKKLVTKYGAQKVYYDHALNVLHIIGTEYGNFEVAPFDGKLSREEGEKLLRIFDEENFYYNKYNIGGKSYEAFKASLLKRDTLFSPEEVYAIMADYFAGKESILSELHRKAEKHQREVIEKQFRKTQPKNANPVQEHKITP